MIGGLLIILVPLFLFGLVWFFVWLTVREKRRAEAAAGAVDAGMGIASSEPELWLLLVGEREHGPFGLVQFQRFKERGMVTPGSVLRRASNGDTIAAAELPGLFAADVRPRDFAEQAVEFQTFSGHPDPLRLGKGSVRVADGALIIHGRRRRLFALRRSEERIAAKDVYDVAVEDRLVRFRVQGQVHKLPRLLRLATPAAARQLAACLPERLSVEGAQAKADAREFAGFLQRSGLPRVTLGIIALNLAIYVLAGLKGIGWMSGNAALLLDFGGNFAVATTDGQWWRLISAMFLHSGLLHVAFNMWALWHAGRIAERLFGRWRYLALYVMAGVLGGIASINWQQDFVGVGASGAVFGVYGGLLAALLLRRDLLPGTVTRNLQASATIFILYSLFNGFTHAGIDNAAHLGGLVAGALVGAALVMPARRAFAAAAVALALVGGGAVRAIAAAEPYRDELGFRQFMNGFAPAEARLNAAAADLGVRAKSMPPQEFLRALERDVIPGWVEQDQRIAALPYVTPRNQPLRNDIASFVHLRRESWELLRDGIRRDDASGIEAFKKKTQEANAVLEQIKARADKAGPGKRGKAP